MLIQIKSRFDDRLLYECEAASMLEALQKGIAAKADLSYANLSSADLRSANLSSADLSYANLSYANLSYADLRSADLRSANLSSANLSYANLSYADLRYADLRSANLRSANLSYANLSYANLSYANLSYADLRVYQTDIWTCYIQPEQIRIGCQRHKPERWMELSDTQISAMDANALAWWKNHKAAVFAIHATLPKVEAEAKL